MKPTTKVEPFLDGAHALSSELRRSAVFSASVENARVVQAIRDRVAEVIIGVTEASAAARDAGEAHGINGQDPLFINPSGYNVAVATNSPAVGAALDLSSFGFTTDFLGATRTDPWTIGAYQVPGTPVPTGTVIRATTARVGQLRRP